MTSPLSVLHPSAPAGSGGCALRSVRKIMKRPIKIALWLSAATFIIAVFVIGLEVRRIWNGYHDTIIISDGPFDSRFPSLYPDTAENTKAIEQWFLDSIPPGTDRKEARRILSPSFSSDLTTGRKVVIDEEGSTAGGATTSVTIHFDNQGRVKSVEVNQHWVYL